MTELTSFDILNKIDVSDKTEVKNDKFTYLSWAFATEVLGQHFPKAEIIVREYGDAELPYLKTELGYFVQVYVIIDGVKRGKPFAITDSANRPLGAEYWDKPSKKYVMNRQPTSFDVNTAIQRAFVKAVAEHGLGLYIFAGEDLPSSVKDDRKNEILHAFTTWREQMPSADKWFLGKEALMGPVANWDLDSLEKCYQDLEPGMAKRLAKMKEEASAPPEDKKEVEPPAKEEAKEEEAAKGDEGEGGVPFPDLEKVKFIRESIEKYPDVNEVVEKFMARHKKLEYADLSAKQFENLCSIVNRKVISEQKKEVEA